MVEYFCSYHFIPLSVMSSTSSFYFCYSLLLIVCLYSTCQILSCSVSLVAKIPNNFVQIRGAKNHLLFSCA